MSFSGRYNNAVTGVLCGLFAPCLVFIVFYLITSYGLSPQSYVQKMKDAGNFIQILSVSVFFANIAFFLLFNHFDMLKASKGILGITIIWALFVFGIKLF